MQKKSLRVLLEKFSSAIILESSKDSEFPKIKTNLVLSHSRNIHQRFSDLVAELENEAKPKNAGEYEKVSSELSDISFDKIRTEFENLWMVIKNTGLTYTALPESSVTKFLIAVAYEALKDSQKTNPPSLIDVVKFLMPSLKFKGINSIYTPEACGYGLPNFEMSELKFKTDGLEISNESDNENKNLNENLVQNQNQNQKSNLTDIESCAIQFLKTHIISDSGEYIIPLWSLNKLVTDSNSEIINNVYYQYDESYKAKNPIELNQAELSRLGDHNSITQSITEIKKRIRGYEKNESTLLGQLKLLSKSLYFNSIHGIGNEIESGSTAELAIRGFFEYFNTLDKNQLDSLLTDELKKQITKLQQCIGIYSPGDLPISLIETCMATRRDELEKAIEGQEAILATISSNQNNLSQLIVEDQKLLKQQLFALNQAIETNQLKGYERLPITKDVLNHYGIDLKLSDIESLIQLINGLTLNELESLMTQDNISNWSSAVTNLENLVFLFLQCSVEKMELISKHMGENLKELYLKDGKDFIALLILLSREKQEIVLNYFLNIDQVINNQNSEKDLLVSSLQHTELFDLIWNSLSEAQRLEALKFKGLNDNTILHEAASQVDTLKKILESLPENKRLEIVLTQNKIQRTVIHGTAPYEDSFKAILNLLPEKDRFQAVKQRDRSNNTMLHLSALFNPENFSTTLALYPERKRLKAVKMATQMGETVLHLATHYPKTLKSVLELYPPSERIEAVEVKNVSGLTSLQLAGMHNPECFKALLELYPPHKQLEAVNVKDNSGNILLHLVGPYPETIKTILNLYPKSKLLEAIKTQGGLQETPLHRAAYCPANLRAILEFLNEEQRLEAVKIKNYVGHTALTEASHCSEGLKAILELLPENERLNIIKIKNNRGDTVLHRCAFNSKSLKYVLELIPKNQRLEAITLKNSSGSSVLDQTSGNLVCLKMILELLPEKERLGVLVQTNKAGYTSLYRAAYNSTTLKSILKLIPINQRLQALQARNPSGQTFLLYMVCHSKNIKLILELLPPNDCFEVLKIVNTGDPNFLQNLIEDPKRLKTVLELMPPSKRLEVMNLKNNLNPSFIHLALQNPKSFRILLELLSPEDRFEALKLENQQGKTVFSMLYNEENNEITRNLLPQNKCLELFSAQIDESIDKLSPFRASQTSDSFFSKINVKCTEETKTSRECRGSP